MAFTQPAIPMTLTTTPPVSAQVDLFTLIHKAIRGMLFDLAGRLQTVDLADDRCVGELVRSLRQMLVLLEQHADHEDHLIFPAIEAAAPGATSEAGHEHEAYAAKTARLQAHIDALEKASTEVLRVHAGRELRLAFFDFLAFTLVHLNHEEETALPASLRHLTDDQLLAIRTDIQRTTPPDVYRDWLRWMLPALNPQELRSMLAQAREKAPAATYQVMLDVGESVVEPSQWAKAIA
jgi:iron-sulfur cluster repair protein YtfE (RIC family)